MNQIDQIEADLLAGRDPMVEILHDGTIVPTVRTVPDESDIPTRDELVLSGEEVPTLIILRGLPYSGKSTKARAMGHPIVCPDEIRIALHGQRFRKESEPFVWAHVRLMVAALFGAGHSVVILDACSASEKRVDEWRDERWDIETQVVLTSAEICRSRAIADGNEDILPIIDRMVVHLGRLIDSDGMIGA